MTLPGDIKNNYKKVIYLDQNFISNIAKAQTGQTKNETFSAIYEKLTGLLDKGRIVIPKSIFHTIESILAEESPNSKLQEIINALCRGLEFKDWREILDQQVHNVMSDYFSPGSGQVVNPFCDALKNKSLLQSIQEFPEFFKKEKERYPERWEILGEEVAKKRRSFREQKDIEASEIINYYFLELGEKSPLCLSTPIISFYHFHPTSTYSAPSRGTIMYHRFDPEFKKFVDFKNELKATPFIDIVSEINAYIVICQKGRRIKPSDFYDILIIGMVLPYCKVLATDGFMQSLLVKRKLDERYGVKVFSGKQSEVKEFLDYLARLTSQNDRTPGLYR